MESKRIAVGIDVGGTGIKGAAVDLETGELASERLHFPTPALGLPVDVAATIDAICAGIRREHPRLLPSTDFLHATPIGIALPGVIKRGAMNTAYHLDASWIGLDAQSYLSEAMQAPVALINDADAAGLAEVAYGDPDLSRGLSMLVAFGTGIGTALINDGRLVPNLELGHLEYAGHPDIEVHAAASAIEREQITVDEWVKRADAYFNYVYRLIYPDRFILGGGISAIAETYIDRISVPVSVIPAQFRNDAGIIGAAYHAGQAPSAGE